MRRILFGMVLATLALLIVPVASADDYNRVYLDPADSACDPGEDTNVMIMLNTSYSDITGLQVSIVFDPNVVNVTSVERGVPPMVMWNWQVYDYVPNPSLKYVLMVKSDPFGDGYGPGELQIGNMTLHGEADGISALHFGNYSECGNHRAEISGKGGVYNHTIEDGTFTCGNPPPEVTFTKSLPEGWNLISLPLTPTDSGVDTVLSGVTQNAVKRYDATTKQFEEATTMDPGVGYFVHVTESGGSTWSYQGTSVSSTSPGLTSGLNMIGVPNCTMSVDTAMGTTDYRYVARWNADAQEYEVYNPVAPSAFHGFTEMEAGEGYFVSAKSDCALNINCPG